MAYIYKIINDINDKVYIGKTERQIQLRFQEHCSCSLREQYEKRPLYSAMKKYGIEHFHISLIEETDNPEEREKFWIECLGTFKNGYNATIGGDGKAYIDYDFIYNLYTCGVTITEIHNQYSWDCKTIRNALEQYGVSQAERIKRGIQSHSKSIGMFDKNSNEFIKAFPSVGAALRYLNKTAGGHIAEVCSGKRKSAYGYFWKYI